MMENLRHHAINLCFECKEKIFFCQYRKAAEIDRTFFIREENQKD